MKPPFRLRHIDPTVDQWLAEVFDAFRALWPNKSTDISPNTGPGGTTYKLAPRPAGSAGAPRLLSGTVKIQGTELHAVVSIPASLVQCWMEDSTAGMTIPWATYQTGQFTINVKTPPEAGAGPGAYFVIGWERKR